MAVETCPKCLTAVSPQAEMCPHCAHPLKEVEKSKWPLGIPRSEGCLLQLAALGLPKGCLLQLAALGLLTWGVADLWHSGSIDMGTFAKLVSGVVLFYFGSRRKARH